MRRAVQYRVSSLRLSFFNLSLVSVTIMLAASEHVLLLNNKQESDKTL